MFIYFFLLELTKNDGKRAIVTGGSRGIGLEIVKNLLESGYHVIIGIAPSLFLNNVFKFRTDTHTEYL